LSGALAGFTILEIMIATAILTVGLVSVLALFPAAINTGRVVMESSTAVVIAESVAEAIREGVRNQLRTVNRGGRGEDRYFVFKHDGVRDPVPNAKSEERPEHDYYVLLPRFLDQTRFSGPSGRDDAMVSGKVFVYPETSEFRNGGGDASAAADDGLVGQLSTGRRYKQVGVIRRTYQLGQLMPEGDVSGLSVLLDQQRETLKQYSFAFAIRVSRYDSNLSETGGDYLPANRLYNVHVMVFRSFFAPDPNVTQGQKPVFELHFEVSV
jgi:hypothetical protein